MIARKKNILIGAGLLAAFLLGGAAGVLVGGMRGFKLARAKLLNEVLLKDARQTQGQVAVLRQLRANRKTKALEAMEGALNDALIMFDPQEPYPDVEPRVASEIEKAISDARSYRKRHPRRKSKDMRDEMVKALFEKRRPS